MLQCFYMSKNFKDKYVKKVSVFLLLPVLVISFVLTPLQTNAQVTFQSNQARLELITQLIAKLQQLLVQLEIQKAIERGEEQSRTKQVSEKNISSTKSAENEDGVSRTISFAVHNKTQATPIQGTDDEDVSKIVVMANAGDKFDVMWEAIGYDDCEFKSTAGNGYFDDTRVITDWPAPGKGRSVTMWLTCEKDLPGQDVSVTKSITITTSDPEGEFEELG